jgi:hypothetical protein
MATMAKLGNKIPTHYKLAFPFMKRGQMTDLQSPQIGLRRASSNKFQSDRLPIVNDGRSMMEPISWRKRHSSGGNHSPADWELAVQSVPWRYSREVWK